jgi:hypothetical protein
LIEEENIEIVRLKIVKNADADTSQLIRLITSEYAAASLLWLDSMSVAQKWELDCVQICRLLGDISVDEYMTLKYQAANHQLAGLSEDLLQRLRLLLKIANALKCIANASSYQWFDARYLFLNNVSIKYYLLQHNNLAAFTMIYRYLNAALSPPIYWSDYINNISLGINGTQ